VRLLIVYSFIVTDSVNLFCSSIDATNNTRLGRYVNDSPSKHANCAVKLMEYNGVPFLFLFAIKDIPPFTELR